MHKQEKMKSTDNLSILYISNYEYILYKTKGGNLYLMLTYEKGFGVYDFTFEPTLTDISDKYLTESEIYSYLKKYKLNEKEFIQQYKEIKIDSSISKKALEQ
jgi:hypothetical protein